MSPHVCFHFSRVLGPQAASESMWFLAQHMVGERCADGRTVPGCPPAPASQWQRPGQDWLLTCSEGVPPLPTHTPCWLCGHWRLNMQRRTTHAGVRGVAGMLMIAMSHPAFKGFAASQLSPHTQLVNPPCPPSVRPEACYAGVP